MGFSRASKNIILYGNQSGSRPAMPVVPATPIKPVAPEAPANRPMTLPGAEHANERAGGIERASANFTRRAMEKRS